ncbi:hypothetical protein, partial [Escherichia coli]|uniref:hypothetical protein n=1 Tax=Escherichia coli TaxID=562 RepID=UPI001A8FB6FC
SILFTQILIIFACYLINNTDFIDVFVVCRLWFIRGIKIRSCWLYNPLPVGYAGFVQRAGGKRA